MGGRVVPPLDTPRKRRVEENQMIPGNHRKSSLDADNDAELFDKPQRVKK